MTVGVQRFRSIRTYNEPWLQRHRDTHSRHAEFGTHRHPYLHELVGKVAAELSGDERPTLLDYGCGKGSFLREMIQSGRFRFARGYDPAVTAFKSRPSQVYDLVVCLDVLDQAEDEFVEPIIEDVAQFAGRFALFDVITVQTPRLAHLNPRSSTVWKEIIGRYMSIDQTIVRKATQEEMRAGGCPERTIIIASPRVRNRSSAAGAALSAAAGGAIETYSPAHIDRQHDAHVVADGCGRHRHLYLHDTMRRLVTGLRETGPADELSWLDYGCGKGGFIEEIRPLNLFAALRGFDPAVPRFAARPEGRFDLVTCLDVLDTVEPRFVGNVLNDVADLAEHLAVFDVLTRPRADSALRSHPTFYWSDLIGRHMEIVETITEFAGMESFERVVIQARPLRSRSLD